MGKSKVIGLGILLEMIDKVSGPAARVISQFKKTQMSAQQLGQGMVRVGAIMTATGAAMSYFSFKMIGSTFDTQKALGELASLGIKDLDLIANKAQGAANQFAGITSTQFVTAAYDIKSAISSLSDSAVADYTRLAAITAKATKGSVEQMGDLYATAYGIYKELFPKLTDARFAEVLSGAIATTVREFKMTGPKIAEYVSLLGATAAKQRIPLAEQFAIGGMLGATMSGTEAATKYTAFLKNPVDVAKKLGLAFTDSNKRLLPMADILDLIRGKFGDFIDAAEKGQLMKAFGRIEGVKLVELLIGKTDELRAKTNLLQNTMGQGAKTAIDMANIIDRPIGQQWIIFKQQLHETAEILGNALIPMAKKVIGAFSGIILNVQKFLAAHPLLTKVGMAFTAMAGFVLVLVGGLIALGGATILTVTSLSGLAVLLPIVQTGILGIGAAGMTLLANPIFLAISALILGAILLIKHWDRVGPFLSNVFKNIVNFITPLPGIFYQAGKKMITSLWEGIKLRAMLPVIEIKEIISNIRRYLPLSPALEGPFRTPPEKYGQAISGGIAKGVGSKRPEIKKALDSLFDTKLHFTKGIMGPVPILVPELNFKGRLWAKLNEPRSPIKEAAWDRLRKKGPLASMTDYAISTGQIGQLQELMETVGPSSVLPESQIDTGGGGLSGGMAGISGGVTIYKTQHFERNSIKISADKLDWNSFKEMVGQAVDELSEEAR